MSDTTEPTKVVDNSSNQSVQGTAKQTDAVSSGSIDMSALTHKITALESDNQKYREQRRERDEQDKKRIEEEAVKKGEFEELWKGSEKTIADKDKAIQALEKANEDRKKEAGKRYKDALGRLAPDTQKVFQQTFGDLTDDPELLIMKLQAFQTSGINSTAANSVPVSQGKEKDNLLALLETAKTDKTVHEKINNRDAINQLINKLVVE